MICEYCRTSDQQGANCQKCGAELPHTVSKSDPFFYNGYIVYVSNEYSSDLLSAYFYLGERLVEVIKIPRRTLREFVNEGEDYMQFFFELFKVSQGETEVLRVQEMNNIYPATFEIRRIENQYLRTFSEHIRILTDR